MSDLTSLPIQRIINECRSSAHSCDMSESTDGGDTFYADREARSETYTEIADMLEQINTTPTADDIFFYLQDKPAVRDALLKRYEIDPWRPSNDKLADVLDAVREIRARGESATTLRIADTLGRKSGGSVSMALAALVKSGLLIAPPRGPKGGGYVPAE